MQLEQRNRVTNVCGALPLGGAPSPSPGSQLAPPGNLQPHLAGEETEAPGVQQEAGWAPCQAGWL